MDDMSWVDDDEFWRKIYEIAEQKTYVVKKKDNSMRIEGLTRRQAALCKVIWSCTSAEEIAKFIVTLPESDQKICDGLLQLLNYEYLEEDAKLEHYEEFPDVEDILKEIKEKDELLVSGTIQIVAINKEFKVKRINNILKSKFFQNK